MQKKIKKPIDNSNFIKSRLGLYSKLFEGLITKPVDLSKWSLVTRKREQYLRGITEAAMNDVLHKRHSTLGDLDIIQKETLQTISECEKKVGNILFSKNKAKYAKR